MEKSTGLIKKLQEAIKEEYDLNTSITLHFHTEDGNENNFKIANNTINDFAQKLNLKKKLNSTSDLVFVKARDYTGGSLLEITYFLNKKGLKNDGN